jgi:uncharacterized membrane protein
MNMSQSSITQRTSLMSLSRFEAFSDGVFAIAATLLALEIRVADLSNATSQEVGRELLHLFPHLISYATSFIVIGVLWLNHHALFHFVKRVDRVSLTINLFLLMCIAFIPCSTAIVGKYSHFPIVVSFYGLSLAITGLVYNALWLYVLNRYIKSENLIQRHAIRQASIWSISYPICYFFSALLALMNSQLSLFLYAVISLFYLLPGVIDRQLTSFDRELAQEEASES